MKIFRLLTIIIPTVIVTLAITLIPPLAYSAVAVTPTAPFLCFDSVGEPYILVPLKTQLALTPENTFTPTKIFTSTPTKIPVTVTPVPCSIGTGTVMTNLNVRSGAGTNFSIVGSVASGKIVQIAEVKGVWLRLCTSDNTIQWVSSKLTDGTVLVKYTLK